MIIQSHIVLAIILKNERQILIAKREENLFQGGFWEFPGGKVETGESPNKALSRELREELDISIIDASPLFRFEYEYPEQLLLLDVWVVNSFSGEAIGKEGQTVTWVSIDELSSYQFPAANKRILDAINKL